MAGDVGAHALTGGAARLAAGLAEGGKAFERELGVDDQRPVVAGQVDDAVGPGAVGERGLESEGALGQRVAHDGFHAALAEGAARLLVGQHVLQGEHLAGEVGEVLLRGVDDGEALVQLGEMVDRVPGRREPMPDPALQAVQPLGEQAHEIGLARAEHLADGLHPAGHLGLDAGDLGHAVVDLAGALDGGRRSAARSRRSRRERPATREQHEGEGEKARRLGPGHRPAGDDGRRPCPCRRAWQFDEIGEQKTNVVPDPFDRRRRAIISAPWRCDPSSSSRTRAAARSDP